MEKENQKKITKKVFTSISARIIYMVVVSLILAVSIILLLILPVARNSLQIAIENNMSDLAMNYADMVDLKLASSADGTLSDDDLSSLLSRASIRGYESSYAYLVDEEGTFLYHNRPEKIGTTVINDYINDLLVRIPTGNYEKSAIFHYTDENGLEKYAGYCVLEEKKWTIVILATEEDIMESLDSIFNTAIVVAVIAVIICAAISFLYSRSITDPIKKLTVMIKKTGELDFTVDEKIGKLQKRNDETGEMCRASMRMQEGLRQMVSRMEFISSKLTDNANELKEIAVVINEASDNNSAISEQLAAYMQETSATTENITVSIEQVNIHTDQIADMTKEGVDITYKLIERADVLMNQSEETKNNAMDMCRRVKEKSEYSIEKSKAVDKINMLTSTIMSISEQTSLLALNASIEAARAGEQGKGFAVVAGEIGNLANQSSTAVKSIVDIVKEVQSAVFEMTNCLTTTSEFIEISVIPDYESFLKGSMIYNENATEIKKSMGIIKGRIDELHSSSEQIVQAISEINSTVGEGAKGVTDIAQKTAEVVDSVKRVREMVYSTVDFADDLKKIVDTFQL